MKKFIGIAALIVIAAMLFVGCGGGSDDPTPTPTPTPESGPWKDSAGAPLNGTRTAYVKGVLGTPVGSGTTLYATVTRDLDVTVKMNNGNIQEVTFTYQKGYRETLNPSAALLEELKTLIEAGNTWDVTPTADTTAATATIVKNAVKDAIDQMAAGKTDVTIADLGGGFVADPLATPPVAVPWTKGGTQVAGTATVVGGGWMSGTNQGNDAAATPAYNTDMSVAVTITAGVITDITVTGDDTSCGTAINHRGMQNIEEVKTGVEKYNTVKATDALTGVSLASGQVENTSAFVRNMAERAILRIINQ